MQLAKCNGNSSYIFDEGCSYLSHQLPKKSVCMDCNAKSPYILLDNDKGFRNHAGMTLESKVKVKNT